VIGNVVAGAALVGDNFFDFEKIGCGTEDDLRDA
jgi:hypothetical protein